MEVDASSQQPATRHTRGVALPGMSTSTSAGTNAPSTRAAASPFTAAPATETAKSAQATPPASPSKSAGSGGVSSVRAAAMRWGQQADTAAEEERKATLAALKASYGVKVDSNVPVRQATMPAPAKQQQQRESVVAPNAPHKSKSVDVSTSRPASSAPLGTTPSARVVEPETAKAPNVNVRPDLSISTSPSTPPAPRTSNDIVELVLSQPQPYHLPPGETLSLDVFHLNSPTDDPNPIDHNHVLHTTEILGIVHRAEDGETGGVSTHVWVWKGDEAKETKRTDERIVRLEDKTGVEAIEVEYRHEPPALAEAFAGQLTICRVRRPPPTNHRSFDC